MKKILLTLLICPFLSHSQSDDGNGSVAEVSPTEIGDSEIANNLNILSYTGEKTKFKKGEPVKIYQWFDYEDKVDKKRRIIREYIKDYFMYDESLVAIPMTASEEISSTIRHSGKNINMSKLEGNGVYFVYDGASKVYDNNVLQATIHFKKGRPEKMYINHYYENGQLQFVREITSTGVGDPLRNTGVLEAYYPNGERFENPLNEEGTAIVLLDENGEEYDQCECINEDIMEWGQSYLYSFIGKYYFLLERIYYDEELECCWE